MIKRLIEIGEQILSLTLIESHAEGLHFVNFFDKFLYSFLVYLIFPLVIYLPLVNEIIICGYNAGAIEQMSIRFLAIATSSADFLDVTIEGLWHIIMNYEPDIPFVDTHSESYGGNYDLEFFFHPIVLNCGAFQSAHSRMIMEALDVESLQSLT